MTEFAVIYAAGSKAVRRMVVSDNPNYDYSVHVGPGEAHIVADATNGMDVFAARAAVEAATGEKSPEPLVAVVDKDGAVVAMMMADPLLDAVEEHELAHAYAGVFVGCTYDKASDTYTAPTKIIPAGIDGEGNPFPETTVGGPVAKPTKAEAAVDAEAERG